MSKKTTQKKKIKEIKPVVGYTYLNKQDRTLFNFVMPFKEMTKRTDIKSTLDSKLIKLKINPFLKGNLK